MCLSVRRCFGLVFALREVTHHTYCRAAIAYSHFSRQLSLRQCGSSGRYQVTIMQPHLTSCRAAIAHSHFSRQLSLRRCGQPRSLPAIFPSLSLSLILQSYIAHHVTAVARALFTSAVAALCGPRTWSLPSLIVLRGPPRIGIPHLVATKFKTLRLSLAH